MTSTNQVTDSCLYMPISMDRLRAALIDVADRHVPVGCASTAMLSGLPPASGDPIVDATAYRDSTPLGGPAR